MAAIRLILPLVGHLLLGGVALAGGGAENVLVVVNQNSHDSLTIANHYIKFRNIPPLNVVYLDWQGNDSHCTGEEFREQIFKPLITQLNERKISLQIDYIVYSAGFPWRIDLRDDLKETELPKQFAPYASLTGATYLWPYVIQKKPGIVIPEVNFYVPPPARVNAQKCQQLEDVESRAFRSRYAWNAERQKSDDPQLGQRYFISSMLGVTVERGNTVPEILQYLHSAAEVDARQPQETFYFMRRGRNPRTTPRQDCFEVVANQLRAAGAQVQILDGALPQGATVQGLMTGVGRYDLEEQQVTIARGAFCDDLTSYGGEFSNPHQTKLSAFLRAGAAGSSGTVIEPYNFQAKFPLPSIHLHYYRGCSLGEAFYQSVQGPYQILLVGDPLCQPWAKPPEVKLTGIEAKTHVTGTVEVRGHVTPAQGTTRGPCELYVDGRLVVPKPFPSTLPIPLDTSQLAPGYHELRLVAMSGDKLEMQGRAIVDFWVGDQASKVTVSIEPKPIVPEGGRLKVTATAPEGATGIDILQNRRIVGHIDGHEGSITLDAEQVGSGPVGLSAEATIPNQQHPSPSQIFWVLVK